VVHVAALRVLFHGVYQLGVAGWRQGNDVHGLGNAARKQAGAVGSWQETNLAGKRTDFC
jgi:hypothetical protein